MVSFSCEACGDVLTKKKLDTHRNRCYGASFTCIDCMVHFESTGYRSHTSCISEAQKYQGALYKEKKKNGTPKPASKKYHNDQEQQNKNKKVKLETPTTPAEAAPPVFSHPNDSKMTHQPYIEEVSEEKIVDMDRFLAEEEEQSDGEVPPPAPSPPAPRPAKIKTDVPDVFSYYVGQATPNLSKSNIPPPLSSPTPPPEESNELVRYDFEANGFVDPKGVRDENGNVPLVQYGSGNLPTTEIKTPAPNHSRKEKDKKRKRLHIDTNSPLHGDEEMTDAPPMLHTGLTGGLNRLNVYPPSPDYSGGDGNEPSPTSPSKKKGQKPVKQHSKRTSKQTRTKHESSGGIFSKLKSSSTSDSKSKKRKTSTSSSKPKKSPTHHHRRHSHDKHASKIPEYKSGLLKQPEKKDSTAMIVYRPRADLFMDFVNKGPESERGCSLNKALKRFHRERQESENCLPKPLEEKALFKSLRLKRNDRGEIVIFSMPGELQDLL